MTRAEAIQQAREADAAIAVAYGSDRDKNHAFYADAAHVRAVIALRNLVDALDSETKEPVA